MLLRKRVKLHDNIWGKKLFFATLKWPDEDNCVLSVAYLLFQEETNKEGSLSLTRPVFSTVKCNENFNKSFEQRHKNEPFLVLPSLLSGYGIHKSWSALNSVGKKAVALMLRFLGRGEGKGGDFFVGSSSSYARKGGKGTFCAYL